MFCNSNLVCFGIVISVIVGAITGILFAFGFIPFIVTVTWILFGLAVLLLILFMLGLFLGAMTEPNALSKCLSKNTGLLFSGILGTIIFTIVALAIVLTPLVISVIVIVAIMAFFFSLMIIGLICFVNCIICKL